jgi:hypothetical protein
MALAIALLLATVPLRAAVAFALVTSGEINDSTDANSYTGSSVSLTSNNLYLFAVTNRRSTATVTTPTVSGTSCSWDQVATRPFDTEASPTQRLTVFRCLDASPGSGALTVDFGGVTQTGIIARLVEVTGIDTGGTNGSAAIVQTPATNSSNAATSLTCTLGAFSDAGNGTIGFFASNANAAITQGSGFSLLYDVGNSAPNRRLMIETRTDNDTTVDATLSSASVGCIALEIKAASGGGGGTPCVRTLLGVGCDTWAWLQAHVAGWRRG